MGHSGLCAELGGGGGGDIAADAAAVRAHLRHHVFPHPAPAAPAGEAARGDAEGDPPRRHRVTNGGIVGKVTKVVDDSEVELQIAEGVKVRAMRSLIAEVRTKAEPVAGNTP